MLSSSFPVAVSPDLGFLPCNRFLKFSHQAFKRFCLASGIIENDFMKCRIWLPLNASDRAMTMIIAEMQTVMPEASGQFGTGEGRTDSTHTYRGTGGQVSSNQHLSLNYSSRRKM
jgi:hypothetical protein